MKHVLEQLGCDPKHPLLGKAIPDLPVRGPLHVDEHNVHKRRVYCALKLQQFARIQRVVFVLHDANNWELRCIFAPARMNSCNGPCGKRKEDGLKRGLIIRVTRCSTRTGTKPKPMPGSIPLSHRSSLHAPSQVQFSIVVVAKAGMPDDLPTSEFPP